jgi:ribosomal protein L7/L12
MANLNGFSIQELNVLRKLVHTQSTLTDRIDQIYLSDLLRTLDKIRNEANSSKRIVDMNTVSGTSLSGNLIGTTSFKLWLNTINRVGNIKLIREATGFGLKEAKDLSDLSSTNGDGSGGSGELTFINASESLYMAFFGRNGDDLRASRISESSGSDWPAPSAKNQVPIVKPAEKDPPRWPFPSNSL